MKSLLPQELTPISVGGVAKNEIIESDGGVSKQMHRIGQIWMANQKTMYQSNLTEYLQPDPSDVQDVLKYASDLAKNDSLSDIARFEEQSGTLQDLVIALPRVLHSRTLLTQRSHSSTLTRLNNNIPCHGSGNFEN